LYPPDLIKTARELVAANKGKRPRQSNLNRAISTAYYALFHTLARSCADMLVGTIGTKRSEHAWVQVYRAVNHRKVKDRCKNLTVMQRFPQSIQDFANWLVTMQAKRHDADYNPEHKAFKSAVMADINAVEAAIAAFHATDTKDRRAFAVWMLVEERKG
jgi:uncharacterized protein (UPF0332 family)